VIFLICFEPTPVSALFGCFDLFLEVKANAAAISIIFLGAVLTVVWMFNRLGRLSQGLAQA
jgi:hypothetical protein